MRDYNKKIAQQCICAICQRGARVSAAINLGEIEREKTDHFTKEIAVPPITRWCFFNVMSYYYYRFSLFCRITENPGKIEWEIVFRSIGSTNQKEMICNLVSLLKQYSQVAAFHMIQFVWAATGLLRRAGRFICSPQHFEWWAPNIHNVLENSMHVFVRKRNLFIRSFISELKWSEYMLVHNWILF